MEIYEKNIMDVARYIVSRRYSIFCEKIIIPDGEKTYLVYNKEYKSEIVLCKIKGEIIPNIDIVMQDVPVIKINIPATKFLFTYHEKYGVSMKTITIETPYKEITTTIGDFVQYVNDFDMARDAVYKNVSDYLLSVIMKENKGILRNTVSTYITGKFAVKINKKML